MKAIDLSIASTQADALNVLSMTVLNAKQQLQLYISAILNAHDITVAQVIELQEDPPVLRVMVEEVESDG